MAMLNNQRVGILIPLVHPEFSPWKPELPAEKDRGNPQMEKRIQREQPKRSQSPMNDKNLGEQKL